MDLIERLEKATGPDRDLDTDIARATVTEGWRILDDGTLECYGEMDADHGPDWYPSGAEIPYYTRDIDAAASLIDPRELSWTLGQNAHHRYWQASVNCLDQGGEPYARGFAGPCVSPAVALSAAALKARAA